MAQRASTSTFPAREVALPLVQVLVILAATLWIYWPVVHGDWLMDDDLLITRNTLVQDPAGWWKIWLHPSSLFDFFPITVSVEWIEWHLFGDHTLGYHLVTIALHIINALLVWRLMQKLGLRLAWLGGLIFAIHPAAVESVAWIAELKNTLSLVPFLLAMGAWIDFQEQRRRRDYLLALAFFVIALLCKTSMVMFPVVILLYAWWKRGRLKKDDALESLPFFATSLFLGVVTACFLQQHAIGESPIAIGGFMSHLALAGTSLVFYLWKCVMPIGLLPSYPKWTIDPPSLLEFLPWLVALGLGIYLWTNRHGWGRHVLLGLGFFIIMLVPFMGFTTGSYMRYSWVGDHLLYIPIISLIGLVIAGLEKWRQQFSPIVQTGAMAFGAVLMALLAYGSHAYAARFVNQETLWIYTLEHNPTAWLAHNNLGIVMAQRGQLAEALNQYEQVLRIYPGYGIGHYNRGSILLKLGRAPEAMEEYAQAVQDDPGIKLAHAMLGDLLLQAGRYPEAAREYQQVLRIDPNDADAPGRLGNALLFSRQFPEAVETYKRALQLNANNAEAYNNMGNALCEMRQIPAAIDAYRQALKIRPDYAEAYNNMGTAMSGSGQIAEAIQAYEQAIQLKPDYAKAYDNLGNVLLQAGRIPEAIDQYQQALRIKPDYVAARNNLAKAQALRKTTPAKK